jgi:transcriptional regulator with XRE-family HTH domain
VSGWSVYKDVTPALVWAQTHSMAKRLHNYLRTYRKRTGLSQDEVAFLLGCRHGTKVSRYERNTRLPVLKTALAYEVVFGAPVGVLFAGRFSAIKVITCRRAQVLARKLSAATRTPLNARRLEQLGRITSGSVSEPADEA